MLTNEIFLFILFSYLTGAIPSAVWYGRVFYNTDVREFGSGNAGATNTFRVLGKQAGIPVLIMDIFKGWLSVSYCTLLSNSSFLQEANPDFYFEIQLAFGFSAVIGHLFPIYTGFRGGKGIATMLGFLVAVQPVPSLYSLLVFLIVFFIFRYVSLSSIIASIAFCLIVLLNTDNSSLNLFAIFIPLLSLITHQKNIERLIRGEETKVKFGKK